MTRHSLARIAIYIGGILLIIFVLSLSIVRQALYAPSLLEQQDRANMTISQRMEELSHWPPLPDHPLYPARMFRDKVLLVTSSPEKKVELQLSFADQRIDAAKILVSRKRYALALTTLTKAAKYTITAAAEADTLAPNNSSDLRMTVQSKLRTQSDEIVRLKPYFTDEQRAIIDRLLAEIAILAVRYP